MNSTLGILAAIGGILAFFFFKRGQSLSALLSLIKTKEADIELNRDIIKNQAEILQEEANRAKINAEATAEKSKEVTGDALANDLADLLKSK